MYWIHFGISKIYQDVINPFSDFILSKSKIVLGPPACYFPVFFIVRPPGHFPKFQHWPSGMLLEIQIPYYQNSSPCLLLDIGPISKIFNNWPGRSSSFFGPRLFQLIHIWWLSRILGFMKILIFPDARILSFMKILVFPDALSFGKHLPNCPQIPPSIQHYPAMIQDVSKSFQI